MGRPPRINENGEVLCSHCWEYLPKTDFHASNLVKGFHCKHCREKHKQKYIEAMRTDPYRKMHAAVNKRLGRGIHKTFSLADLKDVVEVVFDKTCAVTGKRFEDVNNLTVVKKNLDAPITRTNAVCVSKGLVRKIKKNGLAKMVK